MRSSQLGLLWYDYTIIVIAVCAIVGICGVLVFFALKSQERNNKADDNLKFGDMLTIKTGYLIEKEKVFYDAAFEAAKLMNAFVFPKVELCNIIGAKDEKSKHGHVFSECVDFCLFSKIDFAPILIIDLFDNRIGGETLDEIDMYLNRVIKNSGIALLTIEAEERYSITELKSKMEVAIAKNNQEILKSRKAD